uniref:S1 RNA-binding domain-containing protein n=1 Tax=Campylobacter concisus TaxID=199 RepID=UPI001CB7018A
DKDRVKPTFNIGDEFVGSVKSVVDFGVFIELKDGVDGLLHISKIKSPLNVGDQVKFHERVILALKFELSCKRSQILVVDS